MSSSPHQLLDRYGVDTVIHALSPLVSERRIERLRQVLRQRITSVTFVIENLYDPHNASAAIRTLEGFGISDLHVVGTETPFRANSAVTIGADKWLDISYYEASKQCVASLKDHGFLTVATTPNSVTNVEDLPLDVPIAIFIGNEHEGLADETQTACDTSVRIPMFGFSQSFNLSVSVALCAASVVGTRRRQGLAGDMPLERQQRLLGRFLAQDVRGAEAIIRRHVSEKTRQAGQS